MAYFKDYPKVITKSLINNTDNVELTDIFRRLLINTNNKNVYNTYHNTSDLRPEQISYILYGDQQYYWTILLANNITNIDDQWSMSNYDLDEYINNKYRLNSQNNIKHYVTKELKNTSGGGVILKSGLIVQSSYTFKYNNITYTGNVVSTPVTYREYEINANEKKRLIKILKRPVITSIDNQFAELLKYKSSNLDQYNRKSWEN